MSGRVLVVDKPRGPTSHDLVAWARRALGTREVGHAGTLDPLASGVLVLLAGEATKLSPFLSADDKRYEATIALGTETSTLDAAGDVVAEAPVPPLDVATVTEALRAFHGETRQVAPVVSAIKKDGVALHARARRGEVVLAPERKVVLHEAVVRAALGASVALELHVGKGFYVRSLARDLARALGTVGHLSTLRRTSSGTFGLEGALDGETLRAAARGDEEARARVAATGLPLVDACRRAMPTATLDDAGVLDARAGRRIARERMSPEPPAAGRVGLLAPSGALVAVAEPADDGALRVVRGFVA